MDEYFRVRKPNRSAQRAAGKSLPPGDLGKKNHCHKESTNAEDLPREARRRSERKGENRTEMKVEMEKGAGKGKEG